jgi:LuxR family maltose regulon positive regulatory protein
MLFWLEIPLITRARIQIVAGTEAERDQALTRLTSLQDSLVSLHNTYQWIQVTLLKGLALDKQGRRAGSQVLLEDVFRTEGVSEWITPFIEIGSPMIPLLQGLKGKGVALGPIEHLLTLLSPNRDVAEGGDVLDREPVKARTEAPSVLLTQREAEVLAQVAEGLSNKEIAAKLFLSTETVKKHLYNTYQKLEADSRISALAKARSLGILPAN